MKRPCPCLTACILSGLALLALSIQAAELAPLRAALGVPKPGPTNDAPYAPQPIVQGGVVVPLYAPDSPLLKQDRVREPEQYNMSKSVPGRINSIVNIHNPSIEVHTVDSGINTGAAIILAAGGGQKRGQASTFQSSPVAVKIARHATFAVCLAMTTIGAVLTREKYLLDPQMRLLAVVCWELRVLTTVGALVVVAQFFGKRTARIAESLFFGGVAGMMTINFLWDALPGTKFDTVGGYVMNYGLELFFLALSLAGLFMSQMARISAKAEPEGSPSGGPELSASRSALVGGPRSVS